jgi:hypothetical protein
MLFYFVLIDCCSYTSSHVQTTSVRDETAARVVLQRRFKTGANRAVAGLCAQLVHGRAPTVRLKTGRRASGMFRRVYDITTVTDDC